MAEERENIRRLSLGDREFILIGTAHVSRESVLEVEEAIREEKPDRVCVEIDQSRYRSLDKGTNWESLNIYEVIKQRKGFLLLANLVLSSFQRRIGVDLGITPGEEMKRAIEVAREEQIPFSFCDREIQITLRRAWKRAGLWSKNKMLAALLSSVFAKEKLSDEDIEKLKAKNALEDMMEELASYLPSVKEVLIDERDRFLATKIYESSGNRVLAVVGAGHLEGIVKRLGELHEGSVSTDLGEIDQIPAPSKLSRIIPWIIPAIVAGLLIAGFFRSGWQEGISMLWLWILVNGTLSAAGALAALAHPVTVIVSFLAAPITSMNPTIGVGFVSGILESVVRKPRVKDFESLQDDLATVRGFYRNRITHILIVFFFSSVGSAVGTFIGIPWLTSLLTG